MALVILSKMWALEGCHGLIRASGVIVRDALQHHAYICKSYDTLPVLRRSDQGIPCPAAMPSSPFVTGSGSNFSSPVDVAQANAALHGHGRVLIDNLAYAPFGSAAETIVTSPAPMQPQTTLGQFPTPYAVLKLAMITVEICACDNAHSGRIPLRCSAMLVRYQATIGASIWMHATDEVRRPPSMISATLQQMEVPSRPINL